MRVVAWEVPDCEARLLGCRSLLVDLFFHRRKPRVDFLFPDCEARLFGCRGLLVDLLFHRRKPRADFVFHSCTADFLFHYCTLWVGFLFRRRKQLGDFWV